MSITLNKKIKAVEQWLISKNFIKLDEYDNIESNNFITHGNVISIYTSIGIWKCVYEKEIYNKKISYQCFMTFPSDKPDESLTISLTFRTFKSILTRITPILSIIETYYNILKAIGYEIVIKSVTVDQAIQFQILTTNYNIISFKGKMDKFNVPLLRYKEYGSKNWSIDILPLVKFDSSKLLLNVDKHLNFPDNIKVIITNNQYLSFNEQAELIFHELRGSINSRSFNL